MSDERPRSHVQRTLETHERVRRRALSLVASENLMSPAALQAAGSDFAHRYTIPPRGERPPGIWDYPNQARLNDIERQAREAAMDLFAAGYADVRPLSGNNAVFCVLAALAGRGDRVLRVPDACGGHFATAPIAELLGIELISIPYDVRRAEVDVEATERLYREVRPALVLFDSSMMLFPLPLRSLRGALGDEAVISVDVSHPMGIIGGGGFQAPLAEGADLMHGSTHKSFFGPQKGMILCGQPGAVADRIASTVVPTFASNVHSHHIAALGVALEEMHYCGKAYATQVVANARALAGALHRGGLEVSGRDRGFTDCHQVHVALGERHMAEEALQALETAGIFVNAIHLPFRPDYGLRLGLSELTRRGFTEEEMPAIADLIIRCIRGTADMRVIGSEVAALSEAFPGLSFAPYATA